MAAAETTTQLPGRVSGHTEYLDDERELLAASVGYRERLLLVIAGLFMIVIQGGLIAARGLSILEYWHTAIWGMRAVLGHLVLRRRLPCRDPCLFPAAMRLACWGLTLIDRLAPALPPRGTACVAISAAA